MNIYLAGNSQYSDIWKRIAKDHTKALLSYHYIELESKRFWSKNIKEMLRANNKVKLFLDSGAFSAWSQKKSINIEDYITFIKNNQSMIEEYANLDVIGDPAATWENQMIMEKAGLHPIPCFHYGENSQWLKRMLNRGYKYIALGGMVPITTGDLIPWLDGLWKHYLTEAGMPIVKVHGFGLTSLKLMLQYPWYSVDSTSWVVTGRMGSIFIPREENGKWVYDKDSWKVTVSDRSPNKDDKHIRTMIPEQRRVLLRYISEKGYHLGISEYRKESPDYELEPSERWIDKVDPKTGLRELEKVIEDGICNNYKLRDELNVIYFMDLEKHLKPWPWKFEWVSRQNKLPGIK